MLRLLLVTRDQNNFDDLISTLKGYGDIELELSESGEKALKMIANKAIDLVIADENMGDFTGLELVRRLLTINPMINSAVVSRSPHDDFHKATEGLGIMAQLPNNPGEKDAENLIKTLKQIKGMISSTGTVKGEISQIEFPPYH